MNNKIQRAESVFERVIYSKAFCYALPLAVLGIWLLTQTVPSVGGYNLIQYLYTYDHGYVSRGFVGEVISWFANTVTDELTQKINTGFSWFLAVTAALCIGKTLAAVRDDKQKYCQVFFVFCFMCALPFSIGNYFTDVQLNKLIWAITLLAVFLSDKKFGIWLCPVLCALATVINPVFVFTSMVLVAIIMLQEFRSNGYSKKNLAVCIISYTAIIAIAIIAPVSQQHLGFETPQEMVDFYFARYGGTLDEEIYSYLVNDWLLDFFMPVKDIFGYVFEKYFVNAGGVRGIIFVILEVLPIYAVTEYIWSRAIKEESDKFQKFIFLLCSIAPIVIVPAVVISWDISKYTGDTVLVQLGLLAYYVAKKNELVCGAVSKVAKFFKNNIFVSGAAILYALLIVIN